MTTTDVLPEPRTTDPRPAFGTAVALLCDVAAEIRPDQLDSPTPCTEFDVRTVLGHTLFVLRRVTAVGRGEDIASVPPVDGVAGDRWADALREAAGTLTAVWADDAVLDRELRLPFGVLPGRAALATWTGEISTHTWDLAVATDRRPRWDDAVLAVGLAAIRDKLPAAGRGPGIPFADAVPVPDGAPMIDRLVAWQGRDPGWTPRG